MLVNVWWMQLSTSMVIGGHQIEESDSEQADGRLNLKETPPAKQTARSGGGNAGSSVRPQQQQQQEEKQRGRGGEGGDPLLTRGQLALS